MLIMKKMTVLVAMAMATSGGWAQAGTTIKLDKEGTRKLEIGADEQLRVENYSRAIMMTGGPQYTDANRGPDYQYFRMRERVWGKLTLSPDIFVYGRLAHRWQYYTSRPGINNINTVPQGASTWRFPDEVVLDNLYLNLDKVGGSNWSLRLGRFDLTDGPKNDPVFGNGMLFKDGTGRDGGRTAGMDGILATWKGEKDTIRLAGLYGTQEDWISPLNDKERVVRRGDTWVGGGAWTHTFAKAFKTEAYFFHFEIKDPLSDRENAQLEVPGLRIFGDLHPLVDYSVEYARQFGTYQNNVVGGPMKQASGFMLDARLNLKTPEGTTWQPVLKLQYTLFSGDHGGTGGFEGWHPVLGDGALYREECYYIINGAGRWTNLHQYRASLDMTVLPGDAKRGNVGKLQVAPGWASLHADRGETGGGLGGGTHYGEMPTLFVDYQVTKWWKASLQTAYFIAGDYYKPSRNGAWVRLEMTLTF